MADPSGESICDEAAPKKRRMYHASDTTTAMDPTTGATMRDFFMTVFICWVVNLPKKSFAQ